MVVATHAAQHFGGKRIRQLGLGRAMTLKQLHQRGMVSLVEEVRQVLEIPRYREAARAFVPKLRAWDGAQLAASVLERFVTA